MKLVDLAPLWIMPDDERIGFVFQSPADREQWQSCFETPPSLQRQSYIFTQLLGVAEIVQPCTPEGRWTIAGGIAASTFEAMTVKPLLDGSLVGLWRGVISDGEMIGDGSAAG